MRFTLFTDNHVRESIVVGLRRLGWTVIRSVDTFPEGTSDEVLFDFAARENYVLVTNDQLIHQIAASWLEESRPFRMIFWKRGPGGPGDGVVIRTIDALSQAPYAFGYSIEYVKLAP